MDTATAYNIIDQLQLGKSQKKELAMMLMGRPIKKRDPKPLTVAKAKRHFRKLLKTN